MGDEVLVNSEDLNAVDINKRLHGSFSFYTIHKLVIDDVLLLEGETDYIFYSRFTKQYNIFYRDKDEDRLTGNDCTVKGLVSEMFPKGKNIYGIIDPDYNNSDDIKPSIRNRIHVIDANSLETLLVKYSDEKHNVVKAIANFDKLFRKGKVKNEEGKKERICTQAHYYSPITVDVLKWAFFIGSIRELNALKCKRCLRLDFENRRQESYNYKKYIKINKDKKTIDFDKEQYLNDLWNDSKHRDNSFSLSEIKESIQEYNEKDVWDICQGHDIFSFIECLNPEKFTKSKIPKWEIPLLKAFDINNFQGSHLQKWFDEINSKATGNLINR